MLTQLNLIRTDTLGKILVSTLDLCFVIHIILIAASSFFASHFINVQKRALTQSSPVYFHGHPNDWSTDEFRHHKQARCIEIMGKAGADLSLVLDGHATDSENTIRRSSFVKNYPQPTLEYSC